MSSGKHPRGVPSITHCGRWRAVKTERVTEGWTYLRGGYRVVCTLPAGHDGEHRAWCTPDEREISW